MNGWVLETSGSFLFGQFRTKQEENRESLRAITERSITKKVSTKDAEKNFFLIY
jgi:hypothetical protein